jgi:hypothetical protein
MSAMLSRCVLPFFNKSSVKWKNKLLSISSFSKWQITRIWIKKGNTRVLYSPHRLCTQEVHDLNPTVSNHKNGSKCPKKCSLVEKVWPPSKEHGKNLHGHPRQTMLYRQRGSSDRGATHTRIQFRHQTPNESFYLRRLLLLHFLLLLSWHWS